MPLKYKMDVLEALKAAGYNTTRIRREGLFSQSTLQKLRTGGQLSWSNIEMICKLLDASPVICLNTPRNNMFFAALQMLWGAFFLLTRKSV